MYYDIGKVMSVGSLLNFGHPKNKFTLLPSKKATLYRMRGKQLWYYWHAIQQVKNYTIIYLLTRILCYIYGSDTQFYSSEMEIQLISEAFHVNYIKLHIVNQDSCTIHDGCEKELKTIHLIKFLKYINDIQETSEHYSSQFKFLKYI